MAAQAGRYVTFADAQRRFMQQLIQSTVNALEAAQEQVDVQVKAALLAGSVRRSLWRITSNMYMVC
jgi:nucleoside-diphosphate-sugar epimerase